MPAPSCLQRLRKGRSVTPAMGATIRLFLSWMGPIFTLGAVASTLDGMEGCSFYTQRKYACK